MPYLAMTAAEFQSCEHLPEKMGWMACHFSPYGTGLTNLPRQLPPGSLLIVNDRTPIHGHDPERIRDTLAEVIATRQCAAVLLDLQRPSQEAAAIARALSELDCPMILPPELAGADDPVFLPPVPLTLTVSEYLRPWGGRPIWLEAALDSQQITVTATGSSFTSPPPGTGQECPLSEPLLHCHYRVEVSAERAVFTLRRTEGDLAGLLAEAHEWGIAGSVGLYQELWNA